MVKIIGKYFFLFHIILLTSCGGSRKIAENTGTESLFQQAITLSNSGKFEEALIIYNNALESPDRHAEILARKGGLLYTMDRKKEGFEAFKSSIEADPDFNVEVYYSTAMTAFDLEEYHQAIQYFEIYRSKKPASDEKTIKALDMLKVADFRRIQKQNPVPFTPQQLEGEVNTHMPEYLPSLTGDGQTMIFTRRFDNQEDLFQADLIDGKWVNVQSIDGVNTEDNEGGQTISPDGRFLIFTSCNRRDGLGSCDLYVSKKADGRWSKPINLGDGVNTSRWEAHPCFTPDGRHLIFSSNRSGGEGGQDLWISTLEADGTFGPPLNLGPNINTKFNEESPFLHLDGLSLYFRSDRPEGMGAFDIFYARRQDLSLPITDQRGWMPAINMGYPINTIADEGAMVLDKDGLTAYYAGGSLSGKGEQNLDIYTFTLPETARAKPTSYIEITIIDSESNSIVEGEYTLQNLETMDTILSGKSSSTGTLSLAIPSGTNYAIYIEKPGYYYHSRHFYASPSDPAKAIKIQISLSKIDAEDAPSMVLENIFFELGSAVLDAKSESEIGKLYGMLSENPEMRIEIIGHTDNVGTEEDNLNLSEDRAKAVTKALMDKGIDENRLTSRGMGESQPIASNETEEGRAQNRRTEFRVVME